jgi:hypothetical protein
MNYTLHKLSEGFIVTSDEEIKHKETWYNPMTADIGINWHEKGIPKEWSKTLKVIAQQDQIDFSSLSEEEQKEIGWFDVEKLAEFTGKNYQHLDGDVINDHPEYYSGFFDGFQKAQELLSDRRFTLEDVLKIADKYHNIMCLYGNVKGIEYLQSLSQPKSWKIELEMEYDLESIDSSKKVMKPKLTNGKIKIHKLL